MCVVRITVTKNKVYWCHGYLWVQNEDCRPDTKCRLDTECRLQTAEWVQNTDWESKEFFRLACNNMSSYNLPSITQSLFRAQRKSDCVTIFHGYLHYSGIFLAHFLMKIDRNIIWSLHIVFSPCTRVGWRDVCTDFTNVIKVDVDFDVNEMSLLNI